MGNQVGQRVAAGGDCLEPAPPARRHIQAWNRGLGHDGRRIMRNVQGATPLPHQLETLERGKEFEHGNHGVFKNMLLDVAPVGLARVIGAANHQLTPVRLTQVDADVRAIDDHIDQGFNRLRYKGSQVEGFHRQAKPNGFRQRGGVTRDCHGHLFGSNRAALSLNPANATIGATQQGLDGRVLVNLNPLVIG